MLSAFEYQSIIRQNPLAPLYDDQALASAAALILHSCGGKEDSRLFFLIYHLLSMHNTGHLAVSLKNLAEDISFYRSEDMDAVLAEKMKQQAEKLIPSLQNLITQHPALFGPSQSKTPIVILKSEDGWQLCSRRIYKQQGQIVRLLKKRLQKPIQDSIIFSEDKIQEVLLLLEKGKNFSLKPGQKLALSKSLQFQDLILSGGPGSGKTFVIVSILRALIYLGLQKGQNPRIALAAPTGRAAARIAESIAREKKIHPFAGLANHQVDLALDENPSTLHRLLGLGQNPLSPPRYHAQNPLPFDILVVDECSMLDADLLEKLLDALHPDCRLLLVGDKDQLPAVGPGSLLADILACRSLQKEVQRQTVFLQGTKRSCPELGEAAESLRQNKELREKPPFLRIRNLPEYGPLLKEIEDFLSPRKWQKMASFNCPFAQRDSVKEQVLQLLHEMDRKTVLCPFRHSRPGTDLLNRDIDRLCSQQEFYAGKKLLITRNDYDLGLYNGDRGLIVSFKDQLAAVFPGSGDSLLYYQSRQLESKAQSAWLQTVHKSQGSEFDELMIILPPGRESLLNREIIYTALTRARFSALILTEPEILSSALKRSAKRASLFYYDIFD